MEVTGFADYVASRQAGLLRLAYGLTGDRHDAQDLVQTALAKVYVSWRRVQAAGDIDAYVRRVLVNAAVDRHRRRGSRVGETLMPTVVDSVSPADVASSVVTTEALAQLLASLPVKQRAVLVLRFLEDLTERETAELLGISVGTVKSHTSRALSSLRSQEVDRANS